MKTWDFSFWLQDIIVRKLEYSVEVKLEELKLDFSVESFWLVKLFNRVFTL